MGQARRRVVVVVVVVVGLLSKHAHVRTSIHPIAVTAAAAGHSKFYLYAHGEAIEMELETDSLLFFKPLT